MVPDCFDVVEPVRREMQIAADRIRDRLRFVMIVKAGEIAPAGVTAQFDQTGADHDAKAEPAKKPDDKKRRRGFWEWPRVKYRAKKDRQEPRLKQLSFPTVTIPNLADVYDRHVHRPENCENYGVGVAGKNKERQRKPRPRKDRQSVIREAEPEKRRESQHAGAGGTELRLDRSKKMIRRS